MKANFITKNNLIEKQINEIEFYTNYLNQSLSILTESKKFTFTNQDFDYDNINYGKLKIEKVEIEEPNDLNKSMNENNIFISGSLDKKIKIWKTNNNECLRTLEGHLHGILTLLINKDYEIISGAKDGLIKIWNTRRGLCKKTIKAHEKDVSALVIQNDDELISGSWDLSLIHI